MKTSSGWRRALGGLAWSSFTLLQAYALWGTAAGLFLGFTAVGGEDIPPEQKARIMAEGMSEFMGCLALGGLFTPFSIGYLIYTAVARRRVAR
ncbi:MAG TPA: hypothetical protein VM686_28255 [Polyangiaceae bacterium]|nr:hypothetical protein [Polyangiaceae bacterium]